MHALELYVVTKLTNKSARHYGPLLHLTVRGYHGSYGPTGTKTFSKVWLCGNQPIYAFKRSRFHRPWLSLSAFSACLLPSYYLIDA
jgi:hypothetical protein